MTTPEPLSGSVTWIFSLHLRDLLNPLHQSNSVYQLLCPYDNRYVGRTSQRLQQRIKQHVPKTIL